MGFEIALKNVSGVCRCGQPFDYRIPENLKNPTLCESCCIAFQNEKDAQRRAKHVAELADICCIPERYRSWDKQTAAATGSGALLDWLETKSGSVWIGGDNGIGKTHALHYRAYRLLADYGRCCYAVRCSSWLRDVVTCRTSKTRADHGETMYRRAMKTSLLIVDDIGKENLTEVRAELLYDLVDERDRRGLPIWFSTNFNGAALLQRLNAAGDHEYGLAIIKRLKRMIPEGNIWND